MTLSEAYKRHSVTGPDVGHGDKGGTHSYIESYERLLESHKSGCTLMEMGLALGLSLSMWRDYMPNSTIIGADRSMSFDAKSHTDTGTILIKADVTSPRFLERLEGYRFDVVVDDASHMDADQRKTFSMLKPKMNKGGVYIIEDILNLDRSAFRFKAMHDRCEIIDLRHVKKRFDDVLVVYRF